MLSGAVTEEVFSRFVSPEGGPCIDIGCGFGETTQRLAELVGPAGFALGTDSSPRFIDDARREADEAGVRNIDFELADAQSAPFAGVDLTGVSEEEQVALSLTIIEGSESGFHLAMGIGGGLLILGGVISAIWIRNPPRPATARGDPAAEPVVA